MRTPKSPEALLALVATAAERTAGAQDVDGRIRDLVAALREMPGYDFVRLVLVSNEATERVAGLAGWVACHGEPALAADVHADARCAPRVPGVRSAVAVPVLLGDTVAGVIDVESTAVPGLDESDRLLLETLAAQLARLIENARLSENLAKAGRDLQDRDDELHRLASHTLELQEEERARIGRDLHDGMAQTLFGALYQLDTARLHAGRSPAASTEALQRLRSLILQCVDEMDRIVHDLRPLALDDLGLTAALERFANDMCRSGDEIEIEVERPIRPLDPRVETAVYRIVQEALANAVKHGRAGRVRVRLDHLPTRLAVTVSDDGVGFRKAPDGGRRGLGLLSIQERARGVGARLDVRSAPGRGTTLSLEIPLDESHERLAASVCVA
jgi:two-component system, NarL family, sensor kinase